MPTLVLTVRFRKLGYGLGSRIRRSLPPEWITFLLLRSFQVKSWRQLFPTAVFAMPETLNPKPCQHSDAPCPGRVSQRLYQVGYTLKRNIPSERSP